MGQTNLIAWLDHRGPMVGIYDRSELARATMTERWTIEEIYEQGTLEGINRSTIKWLARELLVSVEDLLKLSDGAITWIPDGHVVEPESYFSARGDLQHRYAMRTVQRGGLPVPASIDADGTIKVDEYWEPQDGKRLRVAFKFNRDWFGVELKATEEQRESTYLVMRVGSVFEIYAGENAIIAHGNPWEPKYVYGRLGSTKDPELARITHARGGKEPEEVRCEEVVRVAKIMRRCEMPPEPDRAVVEYRYELCFDQPYRGD